MHNVLNFAIAILWPSAVVCAATGSKFYAPHVVFHSCDVVISSENFSATVGATCVAIPAELCTLNVQFLFDLRCECIVRAHCGTALPGPPTAVPGVPRAPPQYPEPLAALTKSYPKNSRENLFADPGCESSPTTGVR